MFGDRRRWVVAGAIVVAGVCASSPLAIAQGTDPAANQPAAPEATVTTVPSASTPGAPGTTGGAGDPSTTLPGTDPSGLVPPPVGVQPVDPNGLPILDPLASNDESLSSGAYASQPPFDSIAQCVDAAALRGAQGRLATARTAYDDATNELAAVASRVAQLDAEIAAKGAAREADMLAAAEAKAALRARAVDAYVRGDQSFAVWALVGNPIDHNRATRYLESIASQDRELAEAYLESVKRLSASERELADERSELNSSFTSLTDRVELTRREFSNASFCAAAFAAGSRTCADGFVFPVLGEVNFINSFGFPRQVGNANQHWHEGADIMAPSGREIVAVEGGTLTKIGDDSGLGGLRMWLQGDSGNRYYYAHFSAYAEGLSVGDRVEAGTVIGAVGNTGAPGSAPHLHFEIYPAGSDRPTNPFPLLKTAWGDRAMRSEAEVSSGLVNLSGSLPAEER